MTISTWLLMLTLAVGSGTSMSMSDSTTTDSVRPPTIPESHCWINGVWYNPCPSEDQTPTEPPNPEIEPPS